MSFFIDTKRIIKIGFVNFWREGVVSAATVLVMVTTLFVIGSIIFAKASLDSTLAQIEDKVDITVYFKPGVPEDDILNIRKSLLTLEGEVKEATYVSQEESLSRFKQRHENNSLITQSLDELENNPLGAEINIKAKDPSQYEGIANFLKNSQDKSDTIDKINYFQNKIVIEKLSKIINSFRALGFGVSLVLIIIAVIVIFNTIRISIYFSREEISIMRLVGATNSYVRGPFVIEGAMSGAFASIITIALFYPFLVWVSPIARSAFLGIDIFGYYLNNFLQIFAILFVIGIFLGTVSSYVAVRKYLKV
ncbi:MAG: ABC transporter permease [Parcubacteria group bacterium]|nr:ABC transporter permease [Parcubacteria group bacterium]MCR4342724.1 ABC transporter permease [Patescibacteria group bacterium]